MIRHSVLLLASLIVTSACGSHGAPGQPGANSEPIPAAKILDFTLLYGRNCAGCHGENGNGGAAIGLGDPVYLAVADDTAITRVTADGVPGTAMPGIRKRARATGCASPGYSARWPAPSGGSR